MTDLLRSARLFETSAKLHDAADVLRRISAGDANPQERRDILAWSGQLLATVDWDSGLSTPRGVGGALTVRATTVRPVFYASLVKVAKEAEAASLTSPDKFTGFLRSFYAYLTSDGSVCELPKPHYRLGAVLLDTLADSLTTQLSTNGLPSREPLHSRPLQLA